MQGASHGDAPSHACGLLRFTSSALGMRFAGSPGRTADQKAKEAADAFQKARLDLESGVNKQLDTIDKRTAAVREKLASDKSASPDKQASVKRVETKSKTLRADLQ